MSCSICYKLGNNNFIPKEIGYLVLPQDESYDIMSDEFDNSIKRQLQDFCSGKAECETCISDDKSNYFVLGDLGSTEEVRTVYHFFAIDSEKEQSVVMFFRKIKNHKLWINYDLFCVTSPQEQIFTVKLRKGLNHIVFETPSARPKDRFYIYIDGVGNDYEKNMFSHLLIRPHHAGYLYATPIILKEGEPVAFSVHTNDNVNVDVDQEANFILEDIKTEEILHKSKIKLIKKQVIYLQNFIAYNIDETYGFRITVSYKTREGKTVILEKHVYLNDMSLYYKHIVKRAEEYLGSSLCSDSDKVRLQFKLNKMYMIKDNLAKDPNFLNDVYYDLKILDSGLHLDYNTYEPVSKRIFFRSKLDNGIESYHIYIPKNYDPTKKYPLIVHLTTAQLKNHSQYYTSYDSEEVISVDISQRGYTMGSYIGEAAILEGLSEVFSKYSIDKTRVYALGFSNGAFAAWSMAQAYPHLFAGVMAVSGQADVNGMCNLKNMFVFNISSKTEDGFKRNFGVLHNYLEEIKDNREVIYDVSDHNMLFYSLSNKKFVDDLLKRRLNEYPNQIEYYTSNNRHNRAYWITLHNIESGETFQKVTAQISNNEINISLVSSTGVSIFIPPQIDKKKFWISINGRKFEFENLKSDSVHFDKNENGLYKCVSNPNINNASLVGLGILGVFLEPLDIIVTSDNKEIMECAINFATPNTAGYKPEINVKYPIISIIDLIDFPDKNLIIIDSNSGHNLLGALKCEIKMSPSGYEYMHKEHLGKYCILQVVKHPRNNEKNILYINTNDLSMLNKNFFTRKLIIPTYASGYHPYLNNMALIMKDKQFGRVFNYGMSIESIATGK